MTSQGQRFRRRALRRGYKVDEVDVFLDRVEATLNNERVDAPVRSEEVRDVVFRVRFGGYDEWQVDLHLDRVERQLADQEPATFVGDRPNDRIGERLPERLPSGSGMGGPMGGPAMGNPALGGNPAMGGPAMAGGLGAAAAFERGPGDRPPIGVSQRDLPPRGEMPRDIGPRDLPPRDLPPRDDRMMPPNANRPPMGPGGPPPGWPDPAGPSQRPPFPGFGNDRQQPPPPPERPSLPERPPVPQLPERQQPPSERPPSGLPERPPFGGAQYDNEPTFAGFEPGRRGRPDMTSEMRLPDLDRSGPPTGAMPPVGPAGGPPMGPGPGGPSGVPSGDVQRVDQMRRTFQLRRFGSGYDRAEVDRLFEGLIGVMSGRGSMQISESELDPQQFSLVPGGYFESEVDQALREVREILRRR